MKRKNLTFAFLILLFSTIQAQSIINYVTATSTMSGDPSTYLSALQHQTTISFNPDITVSCHEAMTASGMCCYITINRNITANGPYTQRYPISNKVLIRDMVQHNLTDTVFFCGTRITQNGDSVGVVGFFVLSGTFNSISYVDISQVNTLTKLVSLGSGASTSIAAIGIKVVNGHRDYYVVQSFMSTVYIGSVIYQYSIVPHNSTPFDFVSTDDYVVLASYDAQNIYLRRFKKANLSDNMRNTLYHYPINENVAFTPHAAFFGDLQNQPNENRLGVAFVSFGSNSWSVKLKSFDISTMIMNCAQKHSLFEKSEAWGITYVPGRYKVAVLECFDPDYIHFHSSIVLFNPIANTVYTSTKFNSVIFEDFYTINNMYSSKTLLNHFLVGNMKLNQAQVMVHDVAYTTTDNCLEANDIRIDIETPVNYIPIGNPMTTSTDGHAIHSFFVAPLAMNNQKCITTRTQNK